LRHLTESDLAGYLDDDLPPEERRRVEAHLASCDECRDEVVVAARLLAQDWKQDEPPKDDESSRRSWKLPAGIVTLVAAVAATVILIQPGDLPVGPEPMERERFITEGVEQLRVHAPPDEAEIQRDALRFIWASHDAESYRITLTAEDGALLWGHSLPDTTAVPPSTLELPPGTRLFWYVDAIGVGVVARTGVRSFVVVP
jgi:hypothetical protein